MTHSHLPRGKAVSELTGWTCSVLQTDSGRQPAPPSKGTVCCFQEAWSWQLTSIEWNFTSVAHVFMVWGLLHFLDVIPQISMKVNLHVHWVELLYKLGWNEYASTFAFSVMDGSDEKPHFFAHLKHPKTRINYSREFFNLDIHINKNWFYK
jgi:hypothetical protein